MNPQQPHHSAAIIIHSGGQDSTTALYWARQRFQRIHALTFDYGQSHAVEIAAAQRIAALAGCDTHELVLLGGTLASTSPLIDRGHILETYADFATMEATIGDRVELTFVPMRNLLFLTIAANRAVAHGAQAIVTGICQEDNANYPDCRATFAAAAEHAINMALGNTSHGSGGWITIETPLMRLSKAQSIHLANSLPGCMEALAHSHTCYAGTRPPCGVCHACVLRAHGFAEAGIPDPLMAAA